MIRTVKLLCAGSLLLSALSSQAWFKLGNVYCDANTNGIIDANAKQSLIQKVPKIPFVSDTVFLGTLGMIVCLLLTDVAGLVATVLNYHTRKDTTDATKMVLRFFGAIFVLMGVAVIIVQA